MPSLLETREIFAGVTVSPLGFGGGAISGEGGGYGFGYISEKEAIKLLHSALEHGVNLFDTAPIYGFGVSEQRIGKAFAGDIRSRVVLVSKLGVTWDSGRKVYLDNSPEAVERMLSQSLSDLRTDYLDIYMIHWPDPKTPIEKTMETLVKAKESGRIRALGACNFDADLLKRAESIAPLDVLQNRFSVLDTTVKCTLFPELQSKKRGFMSYGTLAKGILSGTVRPDRSYDAVDYRARGNEVQQQRASVEHQLQEFYSLAQELDVTPTQLATAWVLSHPEVSVALCGSKSPEQVREALGAVSMKLDTEVKARLDALAEEASPLYNAKHKS